MNKADVSGTNPNNLANSLSIASTSAAAKSFCIFANLWKLSFIIDSAQLASLQRLLLFKKSTAACCIFTVAAVSTVAPTTSTKSNATPAPVAPPVAIVTAVPATAATTIVPTLIPCSRFLAAAPAGNTHCSSSESQCATAHSGHDFLSCSATF